jgi:hypothetical protein
MDNIKVKELTKGFKTTILIYMQERNIKKAQQTSLKNLIKANQILTEIEKETNKSIDKVSANFTDRQIELTIAKVDEASNPQKNWWQFWK